MEPLPNPNQTQDIAPDKIQAVPSQEAMARPIIPGFQNSGAGISPVYMMSSLNFVGNSAGWGLNSNGDVQFNGNRIVSSHFVPVIKIKGVTFYVSDGTAANGNLSGATGDVAFNCDGGKMYICVGGTTWYAPA